MEGSAFPSWFHHGCNGPTAQLFLNRICFSVQGPRPNEEDPSNVLKGLPQLLLHRPLTDFRCFSGPSEHHFNAQIFWFSSATIPHFCSLAIWWSEHRNTLLISLKWKHCFSFRLFPVDIPKECTCVRVSERVWFWSFRRMNLCRSQYDPTNFCGMASQHSVKAHQLCHELSPFCWIEGTTRECKNAYMQLRIQWLPGTQSHPLELSTCSRGTSKSDSFPCSRRHECLQVQLRLPEFLCQQLP